MSHVSEHGPVVIELRSDRTTIDLPIAPRCFPVSWLIELDGKAAYLRRIAAHRRRIQKELRRRKGSMPKRDPCYRSKAMLPDWLIVANCSRCRALLRSATQEIPEAANYRLRNLIEKIAILAGWREQRPFCLKCMKDHDREGEAKREKVIDRNGSSGIV